MDALSNYNIKEHNLIVWFFRLLIAILLVFVSSLFVLKINDAVPIVRGELVPIFPQSDYKAPFDAYGLFVHVKEGQKVKSGDTLIVIHTSNHKEQHTKIKADIAYLENRLNSIKHLQKALTTKTKSIGDMKRLSYEQYEAEIKRLKTTVKNLEDQYSLHANRLLLGKERYKVDSTLYAQGAISKIEFIDSKNKLIGLKENLFLAKSRGAEQLADINNSKSYFSEQQENIDLKALEINDRAQELQEQKYEVESELIKAKEALRTVEINLRSQTIIALRPGIVNYLFNTKQSSNIISKGELLVSVVPIEDSYYAKVAVNEKDVHRVKEGQEAWLKLNAFNYLEHGLIEGKVTYISQSRENGDFYALIHLTDNNKIQLKPGYNVYGEIVLKRMFLYRYFINKLFNSFT